jgi:HK97 family phage major capsid protein
MPRYTAQIQKHKRDRWDIVQKTRTLLDKSETENRALTTEERAEFDKLNETVEAHEQRIGDLEKLNNEDEPLDDDDDRGYDDDGGEDGERSRPRCRAGTTDTRGGKAYIPETRGGKAVPHASKEYRKAFRGWMATGRMEQRTATDLIMSTQSQGGYLVAPIEISEDVVRQIDNLVFVRQLARFYKVTTTQALGVRQMTSREDDPDWTTEIAGVNQDTSLAFNRRDLTPNILTKLVKVSIRILESGIDPEPIVTEELAYKNSIAQENAFLNGNGTGKPLGVFVASANGVPTSQDVTSGATADFIADDLIKVRYSLKQPYVQGTKTARWVFGRTIVQEIRTFKDSYGQYLWRPGFAENAPDTVLDIPYAISEYAPTVKTTGSYIAVLGDFKYYAIAEVKDWSIQRLVERYADTNEVGFIGRTFVDGAPVLGEAFARLKTA